MEDGNSIQIADECKKEGFNNIYTSALRKVRDGIISMEEVDRTTSGH
jgi:type IV pilus assembly protein PilB